MDVEEQQEHVYADVVHVREKRVTIVEPAPEPRQAPRSASIETLQCDFATIAIVTAWIRHQKMNMNMFSVYLTAFLLITLHLLELTSFIMILVGLAFLGKDRTPEIVSTAVMWILTNIAVIVLKVAFQRNLNVPTCCCANEIGGLWNAFLLILKPVKYFRAFYQRNFKMTVLGKDFVHGEIVTREQFEYVMKVNQVELLDARDDVHDAFVKRLPMALVQLYFFYSSYTRSDKCNIIDGIRFLNVVINLIFPILTSLVLDWKQKIYTDSLHVHGHLVTNGRYPVPTWSEDRVSHFLKVICIITYILSRFFLVGFAGGISLGFGLGCIVILLFSNWILTAMFPSILNIVENLPIGVQIRAAYLVDRWINVFSCKSTRFNELTKFPVKIGKYEGRIPLVFTQVFNFLFSFILMYCFIEVVATLTSLPSTTRNEYLLSLNGTFKLTVCADATLWPYYIQYVSSIVYSGLLYISVICHIPNFGLHSILHLHWILFCVHFACSLMYNYYCHKVFGKEGKEEIFPPMLSLQIFKSIFKKAFQTRSYSKHVNILARLLFLIALDLEKFKNLYAAFRRNDSQVNSSKSWWDEQMLRILECSEPYQATARDNNVPDAPNFRNLPIERELIQACTTISNLDYSYRLIMYCSFSLEADILKEITSHRLGATIEMLQLSKSEVLRLVEALILGVVITEKKQ